MCGYKKAITICVMLFYVLSVLPLEIFSAEEEFDYSIYITESKSNLIKSDEGGVIKLKGITLEIPEGALSKDAVITIQRLIKTEDTGEDIKNATEGGGGYRFLPAGTKFKKDVVIKINYDPLLPEGQVNDLCTYFFDKKMKVWKALERIDIDRVSCDVVSVTNHFTDMINGTLTLPESASPLQFNINSIKNLEAANP